MQALHHWRSFRGLAASGGSRRPSSLLPRLGQAKGRSCSVGVIAKAQQQVDRHNLWNAVPQVQAALEECDFVALDVELSGLWADGKAPSNMDEMDARYDHVARTAQQYSVVQLGLSCWRWKDSAWEAKSFNILTFDRLSKALKHNPVFGVQSSSFEFLSSQGFDFTRWVKDGASCVPLPARDKLLEEIRSKTFAGVIPGPAQVALGTLQTTGASVSSVANDPLRATIASFLRSSQQEIELPAADLKGLGQQLVLLWREFLGRPDHAPFKIILPPMLRDTNNADTLKPGATASLKLEKLAGKAESYPPQHQAMRKVHKSAGASVLLELLCASRKPVITHNGLLDIAFLLRQFLGQLPPSYEGFKDLVARWLPGGVWDTKHIAEVLSAELQKERNQAKAAQEAAAAGSKKVRAPISELVKLLKDNTLENLFVRAALQGQEAVTADLKAAGSTAVSLPSFDHAEGFTEYSAATEQALRRGAASLQSAGAGTKELEAEAAGGLSLASAGGSVDTGNTTEAEEADAQAAVSPSDEETAAEEEPGPDVNKAHEAGFDAFMTGAVMARLLGFAAATRQAAGSASSTEGSEGNPGVLQPFGQQKWRLYVNRSDLPYCSLQGPDPIPDRPNVFHVSGLPAQVTRQDLYKRFGANGFRGMSTVYIKKSSKNQLTKEAYLVVSKADEVAAAAEAAKVINRSKGGWRVVPYAQYAAEKAAKAAASSNPAQQ